MGPVGWNITPKSTVWLHLWDPGKLFTFIYENETKNIYLFMWKIHPGTPIPWFKKDHTALIYYMLQMTQTKINILYAPFHDVQMDCCIYRVHSVWEAWHIIVWLSKQLNISMLTPKSLPMVYTVHPIKYAHSPCLVMFVVISTDWLYPYLSGSLHWHWGNHMIAPVPVKSPWKIWIKIQRNSTDNYQITTTKQRTT